MPAACTPPALEALCALGLPSSPEVDSLETLIKPLSLGNGFSADEMKNRKATLMGRLSRKLTHQAFVQLASEGLVQHTVFLASVSMMSGRPTGRPSA